MAQQLRQRCKCLHGADTIDTREQTHRNDLLQELEGLVYGGVGIKAGAGGELVFEDSVQAQSQAAGLALQLALLLMQGHAVLLQLLIVPAHHPTTLEYR